MVTAVCWRPAVSREDAIVVGMGMTFVLFACQVVFELAIFATPRLGLMRLGAGPAALGNLAFASWFVAVHPGIVSTLIGLLALYRFVNLLRIGYARMNERRLRRAGLRASLSLISMQAVVLLAWLATDRWVLLPSTLWLALAIMQCGMAVVLCTSTLRHVITTLPPKRAFEPLSDQKLPSITVAIPARNETADLEACLRSLVASDYPKLEILVLDDCSQNKQTPEIIRGFAHSGVRFLQGEVPPPNWLAKNYAYQQLFRESNGELLVFCGVDVRFARDSLRRLVTALEYKHKDMISIMPRNLVPPLFSAGATTIIQTMRYAWELATPRRFLGRPPVLSTCWIIRRDVLERAGSFAACSSSITPERHLAKASLLHDGYSFMRSSRTMDIVSTKSLHEQHSTAVRVEYPRLHRRLELVAALSIAQVAGLTAPYVMLAGVLLGLLPGSLLLPVATTIVLLSIMYATVATITYRFWLARSLWALPFAALIDLILLHESMIRYEFFTVIWKERNICIPVMSLRAESELVRGGAALQAAAPADQAR